MQAARALLDASSLRLELPALRADSPQVANPTLAPSGFGAATVLNRWKATDALEAEELNHFLQRTLPEVRSVLAPPVDNGFRLAFRLKDGQEFDALDCSDGMLAFVGLCMHALSSPRDGLVMVEEPEQSLHPLRIHQYVDLLRRLNAERGIQFIIATHSPVLLNEFRDEPEAILLFSRRKHGVRVRRLSDEADLMESLTSDDPGSPASSAPQPGLMLQDGFFNELAE